MVVTRNTALREGDEATAGDEDEVTVVAGTAREPENPNDDILHDEPLPTAVGPIAQEFARIPLDDQRSACSDLLTYLQKQEKDLYQLNGDTTLTVAIVHVPKTMTVRVVYGMGIGTPGFRGTTAIDRKPVCLFGDIDSTQNTADGMRLIPQVLVPKDIFVPPAQWIADELSDPDKDWPLVKGSTYDRERATFLRKVVRLCPVPAYLVLDGFDNDLDIRVVLRRIASITDATAAWAKHATDFLHGCVLQPKASTTGTAMPQELFVERRSNALKKWCAKRTLELCPGLSAPAPMQPTQAAPTAPNMEDMFRQFLAMQQAASATTARAPEEKKAEEPATKLGMAPSELKRLLTMCGLEDGQEEFLPGIYADLAEPNLTKEGKNLIIREACRRHVKYDDAPVPLLATLLKTIRNKEWSGDSGVSTLVSAVKGLSPFLMLEISEEEEARWNEQFEMMEEATLYSLEDLKVTTKLEAKVPSGFHDLRQCLKAFGNLLFALFGAMCPLLLQLQELITAMGQFSSHSRVAMLQKHRASIMWVLFLQTREFATGTMKRGEPDTHLHAFTQLRFDLLAGKEVTNTSVPLALLDSAGTPAAKRLDNPNGDKEEPAKKKTKVCKTHPKLKQAFAPIFAAHPTFSLKAMCEACNVKIGQLFPEDNRRCVLAALKGECSYATCRNKHGYTVSEGEANHILQLLDPVIKDPSKIKKVSS